MNCHYPLCRIYREASDDYLKLALFAERHFPREFRQKDGNVDATTADVIIALLERLLATTKQEPVGTYY